MKTELITSDYIQEAVELLQHGRIVAFPTETVYGLGAVANDEHAIKRVYEVKGRPSDNPLIVHVSSRDISAYVNRVPEYTPALLEKFWPGPLTIICEAKADIFAPSVTAGRKTVALRMPNHATTLDLIERVGFPLVGPSANKSGKPSPSRAAHVLDDFFGQIEGVVYGENSGIGIESTVIDLTDPSGIVILRPGAITEADLKDFPLNISQSIELSENEPPRAPGMKYKHYAPRQPIYLIDSQSPDLWNKAIRKFKQEHYKIGILADDNLVECFERDVDKTYQLGAIEDAQSAAKYLYDGLRFFDKSDVDVILAQVYEKKGIGIALMNRLEKASNHTYFNQKD
ncbi:MULTISPECIES: L-threonylcarbamoyladenylate synthase [unclassified Granulicatella]|uniref:L-threonylcarbamoyladenylate synthase n=1 Tax=unclassified Granulicatella TaxID=2630493 RepID=UPI001073A71A|nr:MULTISPECIES: L-threonylcarbamoyladenylate synthase [unclassified Granulicatella]MBF0780433.1 threonylcarbamoyl-AMP synthase [Granulicatella sp. 19428wC4_WM01]TFU95422.1 threonylcarbamoyl-AMP synthase [Granulicatella sp. WM01]